MTWLEEIIQAFEALGGEAHYPDLYAYIQRTTKRSLPNSWDAIIRQTIEDHSSDAMFRSGKDIFYSVGGKGSGHWGLRKMRPKKAKVDGNVTQPSASSQDTSSNRFNNLRFSSPDKAVDLDEPTAPDRTTIEITRIIRNTNLSQALKELYDNTCQVCRTTINLANRAYSEAHHLQPLGGEHTGPDIQSNMIVVCPNHHAGFDYAAIAINPESLEVVNFDGQKIGDLYILDDHNLDKRYLEYHFNKIFLQQE